MSEANDQPVAEDTSAAGVVAETPAATTDDIGTDDFDRMPAPEDDGDADADGEGGPEAKDKPAGDDESIEVEVGGQKLRVPKAVEPLLLMQNDYTQKTQALAEQRRQLAETQSTLDTQRAQQVESLRAFRNEHMAVAQKEAEQAQITADIAPYRKLSNQEWATLRAQDPALYQQHSDNYEFLRRSLSSTEDALSAAKKDLTQKEAQHSQSQQSARTAQVAKDWEETHAVLQREVKDWTPERFRDTAKFAAEQLGYKPEELREATDPRAWKMASMILDLKADLAKAQTALKQKNAAENNDKAQTVTPAVRPRGNAQPTKPTDASSTAEWMRRRDSQVAKKRA